MSTDDVQAVDGPSIPQRIAQVSIAISVLSVGLTFVGLGGIAIDARPYGRMLLTLGIGGATLALVATTAASAVDKSLRGESDEEAEDEFTQPY